MVENVAEWKPWHNEEMGGRQEAAPSRSVQSILTYIRTRRYVPPREHKHHTNEKNRLRTPNHKHTVETKRGGGGPMRSTFALKSVTDLFLDKLTVAYSIP